MFWCLTKHKSCRRMVLYTSYSVAPFTQDSKTFGHRVRHRHQPQFGQFGHLQSCRRGTIRLSRGRRSQSLLPEWSSPRSNVGALHHGLFESKIFRDDYNSNRGAPEFDLAVPCGRPLFARMLFEEKACKDMKYPVEAKCKISDKELGDCHAHAHQRHLAFRVHQRRN